MGHMESSDESSPALGRRKLGKQKTLFEEKVIRTIATHLGDVTPSASEKEREGLLNTRGALC